MVEAVEAESHLADRLSGGEQESVAHSSIIPDEQNSVDKPRSDYVARNAKSNESRKRLLDLKREEREQEEEIQRRIDKLQISRQRSQKNS